jgi:hypothetical protein
MPTNEQPLPRYEMALAAAMPEAIIKSGFYRRQAGVGSLGRPRWVAIGKWRGALIVREAKVLVPSAWNIVRGRGGFSIRWNEIATGRYRSPDPWFRLTDNIIVRRLSPNNRKIEAKNSEDLAILLDPRMLRVMGRELASIHLGSVDWRTQIKDDLANRNRKGKTWLSKATREAVDAVAKDYQKWERRHKATRKKR